MDESQIIQIEDEESSTNKNKAIIEKKSNSMKYADILEKFAPKKRKLNEVNIKRLDNANSEKTLLNKLLSLNILDENRSKSNDEFDNYKIIEMDEKDKILMDIFKYLKNTNDLRIGETIILNDRISFQIKKLIPDYVVMIKDEDYMLMNNSREIMFVNINLKIITRKFIYNTNNLRKRLKDLGFKSYFIKPNKNNNNNNNNNSISSLNEENTIGTETSEVSLNDPYTIFMDETIKYIYNENQKPILTEENYKNRYCKSIEYLKDLNNNAKYYYGIYKDYNFQELSNYINAYTNLRNYPDLFESKILYLYGPKKSSKTTFLLYLIYNFKYSEAKTLYFNYNYLKNKLIKDIKRIIYHELLYFCKDIDEMKKFEEKKIFSGLENKILMDVIYSILNKLFDTIGKEDDCPRIVTIDNIYEMNEDDIHYLNKIIKFIKIKNQLVKIIICGNGTYFNQKFIEFYENYKVRTNKDNSSKNQLSEFVYLYNADKTEIQNIFKDMGINKREKEEELITKEVNEINYYSFNFLYFAEELDNKTLTHDEIIKNKNFIGGMPLEYFEIEKKGNDLNFNFYSNFFKKCFKNKIAVEIEKNTLTNLLKKNEYPRTFFGICFEKLITLLLMHNKLNIKNLIFNKNSIKEIKEIAKLKEKDYIGEVFDEEEIETPILIIQENFFGPLYDLVIITKHDNDYYSDFIQIGVDKDKNQINNIIKDLENNYSLYKKNILKVFGIETKYISVLFIFDLNTQKEGKYLSGTKICKDMKINSYLFSFKDCELFELYNELLINVNDYFPSFIINEDRTKKNYCINLRKNKKSKKGKTKSGKPKNFQLTDFLNNII